MIAFYCDDHLTTMPIITTLIGITDMLKNEREGCAYVFMECNQKKKQRRIALCRVHTSAEALQTPLFQPTLMPYHMKHI